MTQKSYDAIVLGGDANGLVAAGYLARAGLRVRLLEAREEPGAELSQTEVVPGFRCDTAVHDVGWIPPAILRDFGLASRGLTPLAPDPSVVAPQRDAPPLVLWREPAHTQEALRSHSSRDAERWPRFTALAHRLAGFLRRLYENSPPQPVFRGATEGVSLLPLAWHLRRLGPQDMMELLRVFPMSVAEWLDEWFENDLLKGTIGAGGITAIRQGPRSGGTAFVFLHHLVGADVGVLRPRGLIRGGAARFATAVAEAAEAMGATISYGEPVLQIITRDGQAQGVVLSDGEEIRGRCIVSSLDPHRTFIELVPGDQLDPHFARAVSNIKFRGSVGRVNLALERMPRFHGIDGDPSQLGGVISISPSLDYLERAYDRVKHGQHTHRPYLECVFPSLNDESLAPPGKHVMSITVQYVPLQSNATAWTGADSEALEQTVLETLSEYAPNLPDIIAGSEVLAPNDLATRFGMREGHVYRGELTLDQILFMRPLPGWSRYRTPIEGLFLCGPGCHPGGGIAGGAGLLAVREILRSLKKS